MLGALLAGSGVSAAGLAFSYHEVVQIPAEAKARRQGYQTCLQAAAAASSKRWTTQCRLNVSEQPARLAACLQRASYEPDKGVRADEVTSCKQQFAPLEADECRLSDEIVARFDRIHDQARDRCMAEAQAQL